MPFSASIRSRGYLPHWESDHATYFVTFRLADSLPQKLVTEIRRERRQLERTKSVFGSAGVSPASFDPNRLTKLRALLRRAESCLDSGLGQCYLRDPRIAQIVAGAIQHFHPARYRLLAWCVMPNHVHILFSPSPKFSLASILQSWKSYSAHRANAALHRTCIFWQREYFDHLVRNQSYLFKFAKYIEQNPQKACLPSWPWVSNFCNTAFR